MKKRKKSNPQAKINPVKRSGDGPLKDDGEDTNSDLETLRKEIEGIDFSKDPFFIKKNEEAAAFIRKAGFPKELLEKK